jgi:hypothetical protein
MKSHASLIALCKLVVALPLVGAALSGCGHAAAGKLMVDTPILPFVAPEAEDADEGDAAPAEAPAATPAPEAK